MSVIRNQQHLDFSKLPCLTISLVAKQFENVIEAGRLSVTASGNPKASIAFGEQLKGDDLQI